MKKIFLALTLFISVFAANRSGAQPSVQNNKVQDNPLTGFNNVSGDNENGIMSPATNARAVKDFQKTFRNIKDETWSNTVDGGYVAKFMADSVNTVVAYNRKGYWQYTLHYYTEKKLPTDVCTRVKSDYCAYDILGATEILYGDDTFYLVYVQNDKYTKSILVSSNDIQELENLKKF